MSAVLPTPMIPMLAIEERLKAMESRITTLEKENTQLKDELESTKMLLAASFGRIERLEKIIFDCDEDGEINRDDESGDPILNERLTCATEKPVLKQITDSKTGKRALHLISKLKASGKSHFTHKDIKSILLSDKPEDYEIDSRCKNPRKAIIDVLNEAVSICSDVILDQKKKGHKEWRMVLKS